MPIDIEKLEDTPHLLDILVKMEDILDSLDLYVFRNWLSGEVAEGPVIRRHWLSISLLYPLDRMPDPRGALRLLKHDVKVAFSKVEVAGGRQGQRGPGETGEPAPPPDLARAGDGQEGVAVADAPQERAKWMVRISFPRRLLDQMGANLDWYEDEIDRDDVEAAKDAGIDSESAYQTDEQQPGASDADAPGSGGIGGQSEEAPDAP